MFSEGYAQPMEIHLKTARLQINAYKRKNWKRCIDILSLLKNSINNCCLKATSLNICGFLLQQFFVIESTAFHMKIAQPTINYLMH